MKNIDLEDRIKDIIEDQGMDYTERAKTIHTLCPICDQFDKLSILKVNGATICYRGSCELGRVWFHDWISLTFNVSTDEAKKMLYGEGEVEYEEKISLSLNPDKQKKDEPLVPTNWPVSGFLPIISPEAKDGSLYLENRGITTDLAFFYDIRYSPWFRRVVLPIKVDGVVYGWQARAIDKVDPSERMRNNEGFRKGNLLMFQDSLKDKTKALLFEGPFDALKFHSFGGILCSMGKNVSDSQINFINNSDVDEVYLGLDSDASAEMRGLTKRIEKKLKILSVPKTCIDRCELRGVKADFGECTFMESKYAFDNAKDYSEGHVFLHLKRFF